MLAHAQAKDIASSPEMIRLLKRSRTAVAEEKNRIAKARRIVAINPEGPLSSALRDADEKVRAIETRDDMEAKLLQKASSALPSMLPKGERTPAQGRESLTPLVTAGKHSGWAKPFWAPDLRKALEEGLLWNSNTDEWTDLKLLDLRREFARTKELVKELLPADDSSQRLMEEMPILDQEDPDREWTPEQKKTRLQDLLHKWEGGQNLEPRVALGPPSTTIRV